MENPNQGIYLIRNLITGRIYVGQTTRLKRRGNEHFSNLRLNKHANRRLQASYNKRGPEAFQYEILQAGIPTEQLTTQENHFLDLYRAAPEGIYNGPGPAEEPTRGYKHSEETKLKMKETLNKRTEAEKEESNRLRSQTAQGKAVTVTAEVRKKISEAKKGKSLGPMPEETKKKVSEALKAHYQTQGPRSPSEEHRAKIARALTGRKHSEEAKQRMSAAHPRNLSPENKEKQKEARRRKAEQEARWLDEWVAKTKRQETRKNSNASP